MTTIRYGYEGNAYSVAMGSFTKFCVHDLALMLITIPAVAQKVSVKIPVFVDRKTDFSDIGNAMRKGLVASHLVYVVLDEEHIHLWIGPDGTEEIIEISDWSAPNGPYGNDRDGRRTGGV